MRTLADMTEEERKECRGMWAELHTDLTTYGVNDGTRRPFPTNPPLVIIGEVDDDIAYCYWPQPAPDAYEWGTNIYPRHNHLTPRPDLPRAWTPDGTPPAGEWEEDYTDTYGCTLSTGQSIGMAPHAHIRRWVGDWEKA